MRRRLWTVATLALLAAPVGAVETPPFRFKIPEGWTDLSPGVPPEDFPELPPAILKEARSGKYKALAIELNGPADGFAENLNVIVVPGPLRVTKNLLDEYSRAMAEGTVKQMPGSKIQILEKAEVMVDGTPSVYLVYDLTSPSLRMRQIQYLVPGGDLRHAILTYSATPETFDEYRPVFEASALATTGAGVPESRLGKSLRGALIWGVIGGLIGLVVALVRGQAGKSQLRKGGDLGPRPPRPPVRPR